MKTHRLLSFSLLAIVWIQVWTSSKVAAHTNTVRLRKVFGLDKQGEQGKEGSRGRRNYAYPNSIASHTNCESYLNCHRNPESLEKVDYWTNYFFKLIRPEMRNKRIRIHHTLYRRERAEIRRVVDRVVYKSCQQPYLNSYYLLSERDRDTDQQERWHRYNHREKLSRRLHDRDGVYQYSGDELLWDEELWNDGYYWRRSEDYFFEGLYRDLTDAVFSARHPELSRRGSRRETMNWSTEWIFIRQNFANFEQEQFLKQYLIPLCDRSSY